MRRRGDRPNRSRLPKYWRSWPVSDVIRPTSPMLFMQLTQGGLPSMTRRSSVGERLLGLIRRGSALAHGSSGLKHSLRPIIGLVWIAWPVGDDRLIARPTIVGWFALRKLRPR